MSGYHPENGHDPYSLHNQPNQQGFIRRFRESHAFSWPATLLASGFATAALYGVVHGLGSREGKGTFLHAAHTELTWEPTFVDTKETGRHFKTVDTQRSHVVHLRPRQTSHVFTIRNPQEQWAENFAQDPQAGQLIHQGEITQFVKDKIDPLISRGQEVGSITITGYASPEDDTADAGLATPSARNQDLALRRAEIAADRIKAAMTLDPVSGHLLDNNQIKFNIAQPIEPDLKESQIEQVANQAQQLGMTTEDLVRTWNRDPQSLPKGANKLLNDLIGRWRKVDIKVNSTIPGATRYRLDKYCTTYDITDVHTTRVPHKHHIPLFPVIIPWFRRRTEDEPEPGLEDVPEESTEAEAEEEPMGNGVGGGREFPWPTWLNLPRLPRLPELSGRALGYTAVGAVIGALALINESGTNCANRHHRAMPWPVAVVWQLVNGNDKHVKWSFGVPFWDKAQITLGEYDDLNACTLKNQAPVIPNPQPVPECTVVEVNRVNSKQQSRKVIFKAGPFATRVVTVPNR